MLLSSKLEDSVWKKSWI